MNITSDLVSAQEAAQILSVDRSRILVLLRQGRFDGAIKIGSYWAIPREAVENFKRLPPGVKSKTKRQHEEDTAMIARALEATQSVINGTVTGGDE